MFSTIKLESYFLQIESSGWAQIDLNADFCAQLKTQLLQHKKNDLFKPASLADYSSETTIRSDLTCWIDQNSTIAIEKTLLTEIQKLSDDLKNYFRISLTDFEIHYAIYPKGHFYKVHSDQKKINNKRQFSFVIYLNENWTEQLQGHLCGYKNNDILFKMLPTMGQMMLFKSDIPHEVLPSFDERLSVTGWLRS